MAQLTTIVPTTELEAVNAVLAAAGQVPITQDALDDLATDDVQMAVNALRDTLRATLTRGWKFNARRGLQLTPAGTYVWIDADGTSTTLNIFKRPSNALTVALTETASNAAVDVVEAISLRYTESGSKVPVLFERIRNRDGLDSTVFPLLYVDVNLAVDFEQTPDAFRKFVILSAANRFVTDTTGQEKQTLMRDEAKAYVALVREQGITEKVNFFDSDATAGRFLGYRPSVDGFSRTLYTQ